MEGRNMNFESHFKILFMKNKHWDSSLILIWSTIELIRFLLLH